MICFSIIGHSMRITGRYAIHWRIQRRIHPHRHILCSASPKDALVVAAPAEKGSVAGKGQSMHSSADNIHYGSGWHPRTNVKKRRLSWLLYLRRLIIPKA